MTTTGLYEVVSTMNMGKVYVFFVVVIVAIILARFIRQFDADVNTR